MSAIAAQAALRRDTRAGIVGGVIAGLGSRTGIDTALLRVVFVLIAIATGGLALLAYLVAWAAIPAYEEGERPLRRHAWRTRSAAAGGLAAGVGLLTLSALLAFRQLGIWWSDALVWPLVLAAFGAALLWRRSRAAGRRPSRTALAGQPPAARPRPSAPPGSPTSTGASSGCCW